MWTDALKTARRTLDELIGDAALVKACEQFSQALIETFKRQNKVLICGNGGSHCDALHFAEEFTGRYNKDRRPLPVLALGEAAHVTCVANDYGFDKVFSRQVEAFGVAGDMLIVLSTSGKSPNIMDALQTAKKKNVASWALLGRNGGPALSLADRSLIVPGDATDRIQELHMLILHIAIEQVERELFPENYT